MSVFLVILLIMNKQEILDHILGGVSIEFLVAFYIFALLGVVLSLLFHYGKKLKRDKRYRKQKRFNLRFWFRDNFVRLFTSIICIFILVRFYDQLPVDYELNMFLGILTGMSLDQLIVLIRNKTTINIFQSTES